MELLKQQISTTERGGESNKDVALLCYVVESTGGHMELIEQLITQDYLL